MDIALVVWTLDAGGAQRVALWLTRRLTLDDQHSVTVVTVAPRGYDHWVTPEGADRVSLGIDERRSIPGKLINGIVLIHRLRSALRTRDAVIAFVDEINVRTLLATRWLGVPVVVSERVDPRMHRIGLLDRLLRRWLYPRADAVVVQTESVAQWARGFVPRDRVHVISNPIRPCTAPPVEREPIVVAMGRLAPQKGFDVLIDAFARIAGSHPDWRLEIWGEGPLRVELEEQAHRLGAAERVTLPGVTTRPDEVLQRAGLFVLSSRYEGFPNVLLEAIACGAPAIASDCPSGPAEIIIPGETGLLVPPDDPHALAHAISTLIDRPDHRQRLANAALADATTRYHPDHIHTLWNHLLADVT